MKSLRSSLCISSILACLLGSLGASASAPSTLECTAQDGAVLSIKTGDTGAADAALVTSQGKTALHGTYHVVTHGVFSTLEEYDLADAAGNASKVLVSYHTPIGRGGCGRAGCPPIGGPGSHPAIQASLESGAQTASFECEQGTPEQP